MNDTCLQPIVKTTKIKYVQQKHRRSNNRLNVFACMYVPQCSARQDLCMTVCVFHEPGAYSLTFMKLDMTFALAWGVCSWRISDGISKASWLKELTIAIMLGAREYFCKEERG